MTLDHVGGSDDEAIAVVDHSTANPRGGLDPHHRGQNHFGGVCDRLLPGGERWSGDLDLGDGGGRGLRDGFRVALSSRVVDQPYAGHESGDTGEVGDGRPETRLLPFCCCLSLTGH